MLRTRALAFVVAAALLAPTLAAAEVFTVTLRNGTSFDTRYQPQEASWDPDQVIFLSDVGNWIAVERSEVASVTSYTESLGFGKVINTTTIALGWAPNDRPDEAAAGQAGQVGLTATQVAAASAALRQSGQAAIPTPEQSPYSVQQFVEPSAAQGIPGGLIGFGGAATGQPTQ